MLKLARPPLAYLINNLKVKYFNEDEIKVATEMTERLDIGISSGATLSSDWSSTSYTALIGSCIPKPLVQQGQPGATL